MGSFNMKCHSGVVNTGDNCVIFFVLKHQETLSGIYSPISLPIHCAYDDYNRWIENDSSDIDTISSAINHINAFKDEHIEQLTFDNVFELIHDGNLTIEGQPVGVFCVHESYYNTVLLKTPRVEYQDWIKTSKELFDKFGCNSILEHKSFQDINSLVKVQLKHNIFFKLFDTLKHNIHSPKLDKYMELVTNSAKFFGFMNAIVFDFAPVLYAGQTTPYSTIELHHEMCLDILQNNKLKYEDL